MNTPQDTLWQLINRLTPAEKRYFKTHFSSPNNRLTTLFNLLNQQSDYDEIACRTALDVPAAHYKVLKTQLQDLLLRSLIANHGKQNLLSRIRLGLEEVDLLLERELFAEAEKRLRKLNKLCQQYGFTLYSYEITEKLQALIHLEIDVQDEDAQRYYRQLQQLQQKLNQKQQLHAIQMELEAWTPFTPNRSAFGQRLLTRLKDIPAEQLDFQSKLGWMQNIAICYEILGQNVKATHYRKKILDQFTNNTKLRERLPFNYLRALRYQANAFINALDTKIVKHNVNEAYRLIALFPQYSPHLVYFHWAELRNYFSHHHWHKIVGPLEVRTCTHLINYQLHTYHVTTDIYQILICTHLILEQNQEAQEYLDLLDQIKSSKHPHHLLTFSILQLVAYWEAREFNELLRVLRNHQRRLARKRLFDQSSFAQGIFHFFHAIVQKPQHAQTTASTFLLDLSAYRTDLLFPYFSFLHLERWLQAMAGNIKWRNTFATNK